VCRDLRASPLNIEVIAPWRRENDEPGLGLSQVLPLVLEHLAPVDTAAAAITTWVLTAR
jgi:hypothetical protein